MVVGEESPADFLHLAAGLVMVVWVFGIGKGGYYSKGVVLSVGSGCLAFEAEGQVAEEEAEEEVG